MASFNSGLFRASLAARVFIVPNFGGCFSPSPRVARSVIRFLRHLAVLLMVTLSAWDVARGEIGLQADESPEPKNAIERQALASTVRIRVRDGKGDSFGTGTVIDQHEDEVLVLTCGHIFRESGERGDILCDMFVANGPQGVPAKMISYDLRRDVGLISLRPGVAVPTAPVGGGGHQVREGSFVFTVGCSKGADPTLMRNRVVAINRYHGPANLVVGGCPVDGRSGGGLFSETGVLIGVCNAADQKSNEGLYAALGPIHTELDEAGLGFIYRREIPLMASAQTEASSSTELPSGQGQQLHPIETRDAPRPVEPMLGPSIRNESPPLEGAHKHTTAELICILKGSDPQAENKVFVIDQPSPELLSSLSAEIARRGPHSRTALERNDPKSQTPLRTKRLPKVR